MLDHFRRPGQPPNFLSRAVRLLERSEGRMRPGHLYQLRVRHDDWCRHWGGGACDCDPECSLVEVGTPERN
jgi:hypothetical protein